MTTAASGSICLAEEAMRTALASCTSFQTLVGAESAEEAAARVYIDALPPPADDVAYTDEELEEYRPYALIDTGDDAFTTREIASYQWTTFGEFNIEIERSITEEHAADVAEVERTWKNAIGGIIDDLRALNEGLDITAIQFRYRWRERNTDVSGMGMYQGAMLSVSWGAQ